MIIFYDSYTLQVPLKFDIEAYLSHRNRGGARWQIKLVRLNFDRLVSHLKIPSTPYGQNSRPCAGAVSSSGFDFGKLSYEPKAHPEPEAHPPMAEPLAELLSFIGSEKMKEKKSVVISLTGQVDLVIGAASGIGKGTARRLGIPLAKTIDEIEGVREEALG